MTREKWKLIGWECLFLLICIILGCVAMGLQTIGKEYIGDHSSFIFSGHDYNYNVPAYVLGLIFFIGLSLLAYHLILRKKMVLLREGDMSLRFWFSVLAFLFAALMLGAFVYEMFAFVGLSNNLKPSWMFILTGFGWPGLTFFFMIIMMIRVGRIKSE